MFSTKFHVTRSKDAMKDMSFEANERQKLLKKLTKNRILLSRACAESTIKCCRIFHKGVMYVHYMNLKDSMKDG